MEQTQMREAASPLIGSTRTGLDNTARINGFGGTCIFCKYISLQLFTLRQYGLILELSIKVCISIFLCFPCQLLLPGPDWLHKVEAGNLVWLSTNRRRRFLQLSVHQRGTIVQFEYLTSVHVDPIILLKFPVFPLF